MKNYQYENGSIQLSFMPLDLQNYFDKNMSIGSIKQIKESVVWEDIDFNIRLEFARVWAEGLEPDGNENHEFFLQMYAPNISNQASMAIVGADSLFPDYNFPVQYSFLALTDSFGWQEPSPTVPDGDEVELFWRDKNRLASAMGFSFPFPKASPDIKP